MHEDGLYKRVSLPALEFYMIYVIRNLQKEG